MSKTTIVANTTDAAVYLPLGSKDDITTVTVPRAIKQKVKDEKTGDDRMVTTHGTKEVDSDLLADLRSTNKVVAGYFANGRLKEVGSGPPPNPSNQGSKGK
jgi:hypothetical protein